jgi:hypothetical protein
MSRFLAFGALAVSFVSVGCASASPGTGEQVVEPETASAENQALGTFLFEVDPSQPPERMIRVSDITAFTKPITRPGQIAQAVSEVTSSVYVYNATTPVWTASGAGGYTTVKFGVQNLDTANSLDEPYLQITSISLTTTGGGTVTFQENATPSGHTFVSSALGSHTGGTYYLADMNTKCTVGTSVCASGKKDIALQNMKISVSSSTMKYNFVAKVYATPKSDTTGIYPDLDQDTWNTEPYTQKAGGDCSDSATSVPYATCGSSGCATTCNTTAGGSCPSSGSSTDCCTQTGATTVDCPNTTPSCTCDVTFGTGSNGSITCQAGSSCDATYPSGSNKDVDVYCKSGANCNLDCSNNTGIFISDRCEMHGCNVGNCTMTCPGGRVGCYNSLTDTATCQFFCF